MKFPNAVFPSFLYACYIEVHQYDYVLILGINLKDNIVRVENNA